MDLGLTALELARIQFAFTVSFHIIFPATSIGLACFLAVLEWKWLRSHNPIYQDLYKYWLCTRQISQNPYPIRILLS